MFDKEAFDFEVNSLVMSVEELRDEEREDNKRIDIYGKLLMTLGMESFIEVISSNSDKYLDNECYWIKNKLIVEYDSAVFNKKVIENF